MSTVKERNAPSECGRWVFNMMYMAYIQGWNPVIAFADTEEKAKKLAIKDKKSFCKDDLRKWTWDTVSEYYGAWVEKVVDGKIIRL